MFVMVNIRFLSHYYKCNY